MRRVLFSVATAASSGGHHRGIGLARNPRQNPLFRGIFSIQPLSTTTTTVGDPSGGRDEAKAEGSSTDSPSQVDSASGSAGSVQQDKRKKKTGIRTRKASPVDEGNEGLDSRGDNEGAGSPRKARRGALASDINDDVEDSRPRRSRRIDDEGLNSTKGGSKGDRGVSEELDDLFPGGKVTLKDRSFELEGDWSAEAARSKGKAKKSGQSAALGEEKSDARPKQDYRVVSEKDQDVDNSRKPGEALRKVFDDDNEDWMDEDMPRTQTKKGPKGTRSSASDFGDGFRGRGEDRFSNESRRRDSTQSRDGRSQGFFSKGRDDRDNRRQSYAGEERRSFDQGGFERRPGRFQEKARSSSDRETRRFSDRDNDMSAQRSGRFQDRERSLPRRFAERDDDRDVVSSRRRDSKPQQQQQQSSSSSKHSQPSNPDEDDELDAEVRRSVEEYNRKQQEKQQRKAEKKKLLEELMEERQQQAEEASGLNNRWGSSPRGSSFGKQSSSRAPRDEQAKRDLYGDKIELSDPANNDFFYGKHPIQIALHWTSPDILASSRLIVQEGSDAQNGPEMLLARSKGTRIEIASRMRMNEVLGSSEGFSRPHQGLIMELPKLEYRTIKKDTIIGVPPEAKDTPVLVLALDEVMDPMNLGAILRSAHFFNVFAVLASEKNSAPLSPTVCKASAGAAFVMNAERRLLGTKNLVASLQAHRKAGWRVVGTSPLSSGGDASSPVVVTTPSALEPHPRTILVMGNEEMGIRTLVRDECDVLLNLHRPDKPPMTMASIHHQSTKDETSVRTSEENKIALNVSAATAAILARLRL